MNQLSFHDYARRRFTILLILMPCSHKRIHLDPTKYQNKMSFGSPTSYLIALCYLFYMLFLQWICSFSGIIIYYLNISFVSHNRRKRPTISGSTPSAGRVEIFYDGQWGTICDHGWDMNDANVLCKQLGFPQASQAYSGAAHGQGTGPIWMDDVACSGSDSNIYDCSHRGWGSSDCTHGNDASVECSYGSSVVRLADGGNNYGRVETYENGQWGTVCDDSWDMNDANVVCRQLGFSGATSAPKYAAYGQGSGPILRDHIDCQGSEASLLSCPADQVTPGHCNLSEDSSAVCD